MPYAFRRPRERQWRRYALRVRSDPPVALVGAGSQFAAGALRAGQPAWGVIVQSWDAFPAPYLFGLNSRFSGSPGFSAQLTDMLLSLTQNNVTSNGQLGTLPVDGVIAFLVLRETAGQAVSVGIGSSSGTTDVLSPQQVAASSALMIPIPAFSAAWFSASAAQVLYLTSSAWGGASINASLFYVNGP